MRGRASARLAGVVALSICLALTASISAGKKKQKKRRQQQGEVPIVCYDVALQGGMALLAQTSGLSLWDVSDPLRPKSKYRLPLPATVRGVEARAPFIYLAAGSHGMYIARWDSENAPEVVSRHDTPGSVTQVLLSGHYAFLADERYGVRVVDVEIPERPLQKAQVSTRDRVRSMALDGHILAIAESSVGVRLFDVERPERPVELLLLRDATDARDVAWAGERLLVASAAEGLLVYGSGPDGKLRRVGRAEIKGVAAFVDGEGSLVVVGNGTPALQLVRLDDDGRPTVFGELRLHRSAPAGRVHLVGGMAYVALDRAGISIIDLEDPLAPDILLPRERELRIEWPGNDSER